MKNMEKFWSNWNDLLIYSINGNSVNKDFKFTTSDSNSYTNYKSNYNLYEFEDKYLLEFYLAGYKKEDVEIEVENGVLSISGKREIPKYENSTPKYKGVFNEKFKKEFEVDSTVNIESIKANFSDGVLIIELFKHEDKKPKKITIG